jgi:corrinoid protein of di/trimethylamine methyltransferase
MRSVEKTGAFEKMRTAIIGGHSEEAAQIAKSMAGQIDPLEMVNEGMMPAMKTVGDRFSSGEFFLPEMLEAAEAWNEAMKILKPIILEKGERIAKVGTVVIGTVQTDIHEIGKSIVANMMTASGFEVHDLGIDVSPSKFVERAEEVKANIIAASAIMTTTMPYQKDVIDYLKAKGLRDKYIVLVGGGVVNQEWADEIGADGYAELASDAGNLAERLLAERGLS